MTYDKIILGAGLYGLYAAQKCGAAGQRVLVLERDPAPFMRATYINQARVHMGYHYPRSYSTAIKSAHYFERFCNDYGSACTPSLTRSTPPVRTSPGRTRRNSAGSARRQASAATTLRPSATSTRASATARS